MENNGPLMRVMRSFTELEEIREYWRSVVDHPNADFDFFSVIVRCRPEIKGPCVFVLYQDGAPQALLIGRIEDVPVEIKVGYLRLPSPRVRQLTVVYGGMGGTVSETDASRFVTAIQAQLAEGTFEAVMFNHLCEDSPLLRAVRQRNSFPGKDYGSLSNPHWTAALPRTMEEFMGKISKNHRYALRSQAKKIETEFKGAITVRIFTRADEVAVLCRDTEAVAKNTYQRGIGAGFLHNPEMEERLSVYARGSHLRGYLLYLKGVPCAFCIGTLYKQRIYMDFTGYDAGYHGFAPGTYVFMKMIEDICSNTDAVCLDFGFGDADYKRRFGDRQWNEATLMMFAGSPKGCLLHLARQTTLLSTRVIHGLLANGLIRFIKKKWRDRLGHGSSAPKVREKESE